MNGLGRNGWLVLAVIGAQVAIPTIALMLPPPTRFGFQMYSALGYVEVTATDDSGDDLDVDPELLIPGMVRPELDFTRRLPEYVCEAVPEAVEVTVRQPEHERSVVCS